MIIKQLDKKHLKIGNNDVIFDYSISKYLIHKNFVIILLDYGENLVRWGQFPNLFCANEEKGIIWKAELPTSETGDSYFDIKIKNNDLHAYSVCSYDCIMDIETGKIISSEFTK